MLFFLYGLVEGLWFGHFSVAEGFYNVEDFRPGGEGTRVRSFVFVDGEQELELLIRHSPFFRCLAVVAEPAAWSSTAVQAEAPVNNIHSSAITVTTFFRFFLCHRIRAL